MLLKFTPFIRNVGLQRLDPLAYLSALPSARCQIQSYSVPAVDPPTTSASTDIQLPSQTARVESSPRRFWKKVDVHKEDNGQYAIRLDLRNLKTPSGNTILLPSNKLVLATLIAREWDEQRKVLKQHSLPLTSLVSRAIDGMKEFDRIKIVDDLMNYLDTDTICFHESEPKILVEMQIKHWIPLVEWVQKSFQINLKIHKDSITFEKQSQNTHSILKNIVNKFDPLKLAAFERAVLSTKSFIISLALVEGQLSIDEASDASRVEVLSQIHRWGEVEDTHDVDHQEIRMKLGSVKCALIDIPSP